MARLPTPGGDNGNWGSILNDYLSESHKSDGKIKDNVVTNSAIAPDAITSTEIQDGTISEAQLAPLVQTKLNSVAGNPDWSTIANKPVIIAAGANKRAARTAIGATPGKTFFVDDYGSDPTGAVASDTAVAAAIAALGAGPGVVEFGAGTYRLNNPHELSHAAQFFRMQGLGVTTIDARANGVTLRVWDSTADPTGNAVPGYGGGFLGGARITGHNNTNVGAVGIQIGDLVCAQIDFGFRVHEFYRAGQIGCLLQSRFSWLEYADIHVRSDYNTVCFEISAHPSHPHTYGPASFSYSNFDLNFGAYANQKGVVAKNGVTGVGIAWHSLFNLGSDSGETNSGIAFEIGMDDTYCQFNGEFRWHGENNCIGETHRDIMLGEDANLRGYGSLVFEEFESDENKWLRAGNATPEHVRFFGTVNCPSLGHYAQREETFVTLGAPVRSEAKGDNASRYFLSEDNQPGDYSYTQLFPRGPHAHQSLDLVSTGYGRVTINGKPVTEMVTEGIAAAGNVGVRDSGFSSGWQYIHLATLPIDDYDTNEASLSIMGRMGYVEPEGLANWNILLQNRSDESGDHITSVVSVVGENAADAEIWNRIDIRIFKQADKSAIVYIATNGFWVHDLVVRGYKATVDWTDLLTPVTPTGTQIWSLKEAEKFAPSDAEPVILTSNQDIHGEKTFADDLRVGYDVSGTEKNALYVQASAPNGSFVIYDGSNSIGQDTYLSSKQLKSVGPPTDYFDAATKGYVDDKVNAGVPWGPTANGQAGQFSYDATHIYVCVATNTWLRANLSTW